MSTCVQPYSVSNSFFVLCAWATAVVSCSAGTVDGTQTSSQPTQGFGAPAKSTANCTPTTCEEAGANCNSFDDGCGGTLDCGVCTLPMTCGGTGTANVCGTPPAPPPPPPPPPPPTGGSDPIIVAGGDIAGSWSQDTATAALIGTINPAAVLTMGDNAYDSGSSTEFTNYFATSWGTYKAKINPTPGNHDHATANLAGYCGYFGAAAHCQSGLSYYSYDIGAWHLIALDSGCSSPSSCAATMASGAMRTWLTNDLATHKNACTLAYWHHPRFSSGEHGNDTRSQSVWAELQAAGVDIILNGHDHNYERFNPQNSTGAADPNGIVEFVVGSGGAGLRALSAVKANSAVANPNVHGVLKLTLHPTSYDFQFVPIAGQTLNDAGSNIPCQ